MTITTMDAIKSLVPDFEGGVSTTANPDDGETIIWNNPKIASVTLEEIDAEKTRLLAEWEAQEYARNRELEYPTVQELVVALYDEDDKAAIETKRAEIKAKYPKPE